MSEKKRKDSHTDLDSNPIEKKYTKKTKRVWGKTCSLHSTQTDQGIDVIKYESQTNNFSDLYIFLGFMN